VDGSFTLFFSKTSRQTYQKAGMMYQGIAYVVPPMTVTGATLAGGRPTSPSICRAKLVRSRSWPMPAKRAGAPVSS